MNRAVLDCNVLVSALIRPEGAPGKIAARLFEGAFDLVSSSAILSELARCLRYKKVRKYIKASEHELELWLSSLELIAVMAEGVGPFESRLSDPEDAIYLNAAFVGRADYIVSGDSHLLELETYEGTSIVTPTEYLRELS